MFPFHFVQIRDAIMQQSHRFLGSINDFLEIGTCLHGLGARKHELGVSADGCQIINEPVGNFFGALKLIHKFLSQGFTSTLLITVFWHFLPAPFSIRLDSSSHFASVFFLSNRKRSGRA